MSQKLCMFHFKDVRVGPPKTVCVGLGSPTETVHVGGSKCGGKCMLLDGALCDCR